MLSARGGALVPYNYEHHDELKRRLEKLSRTYDLATMKIFMTVEALGENNVFSTYEPVRMQHPQLRQQLDKLTRNYDFSSMKIFMTSRALGDKQIYDIYDPAQEKRANWEQFLIRQEACRLDLTRHEKTREKYQHFLTTIGREEQGKQFFHSMIALLQSKGAADIFKHTRPKYQEDLDSTFCGHLCKLFDKKIETWFDAFEAVNVSLTAHVKVSNFVRVLTGQVDVLCRKNGFLYAINIKVTGMPTPRPMDVNELCLVKAMIIQNGLAAPEAVICGLLVCHLGEERPVLRLWEYRPTREMDTAIREADIDRIIDAGKLSHYHEMWPQNVCPPGVGSITARLGYNGAAYKGPVYNGPPNNGYNAPAQNGYNAPAPNGPAYNGAGAAAGYNYNSTGNSNNAVTNGNTGYNRKTPSSIVQSILQN